MVIAGALHIGLHTSIQVTVTINAANLQLCVLKQNSGSKLVYTW